MKYNEKVLNEFFNPQNVGVIKGASGKGKVVDPKLKEIVKLYILVENGTIKEAAFQAFGCTATIACCSVATRLVIGKSIEDAYGVTVAEIEKELGSLPETKKNSLALAAKMVVSALDSYKKKAAGGKDEDDD